ncbi:TonB-dependent receptor [Novosphingobium cyanobacteriorum]|uniref:TonB-dependent receptor n=1 Tax=Novosphingobium cyanobacteriorum TaxID=3024215 RepID=A0ABT6CML4_9SPHN|nr:TonB-dependent receptor [Novosphingobium cyanobacteriorum]MDF8335156.1 TonB-dependent receptor [Novosphingobium cyanobacteriorum]
MKGTIKGLLLASCMLGGAQVSFAQDAQPQAGAAPAGGLEEIIVTARKREESVQTVPVAVTAISEKTIQARDITSIEKIAAATPNLSVGRASNGSGAQLTMRGIGSSSTSIGIEQSVAVVVDGAYYGQGRIIQEGFFDLKRVEVLKGPQALFFGKNATAGVISLTTNDPGNEREFIARAAYEFKAKQYLGEFIASAPLSDTFGVRLALRGSIMDGAYYDNVSVPRTYVTADVANGFAPTPHTASVASDGPGEREFLGRLTLKYTPTSDLTVTVKGSFDYNKTKNSSWNYVAYNCGLASGVSQLSGYKCGTDFVTHQNNIPADIAKTFPFSEEDGQLYNRYRSWAVNGNIVYTTGDVTISSVTNYNTNNNRWACACDFQSSNNGTWATENSTWRAFSQELRAQTAFDGPINLMVGGLYQKTKRLFDQNVMFAGLENSAASPANRYLAGSKSSFTDGETGALFGQVTWKVLPTVEVAGGVRYTHETKKSFFVQPYNNPFLTTGGGLPIFRGADSPDGLGVINARQVFDDWSPEVTLTWKPQQGILVYGAYKTAYKSGGFSNGGINSLLSTDPLGDLTFNPEKARGFEAGIKTTLADNQLRLNLTAFTYKYGDLQVDFFNSPIFAFQTLTADARTKGVEAEFEFAPRSLDGLNVHGSINYTRARYTSFPLGPCYAGQTPAEGCNLTASGAVIGAGGTGVRQNLSGRPLSVAPEWTGAFGVGYDTAVGSGYKLGLNIDARFSSSYLASGFGAEHSKQDKYATLDAGIRFGAEDDNWQIALIGKNLTNTFYVSGVVDGPSTGAGTGTAGGLHADQLGFGNLPRTVQVSVTKRF